MKDKLEEGYSGKGGVNQGPPKSPRPEPPKGQQGTKAISDALDYATGGIDCYSMEIRNYKNGKLLKEGFCQGQIFKDALGAIDRILNKTKGYTHNFLSAQAYPGMMVYFNDSKLEDDMIISLETDFNSMKTTVKTSDVKINKLLSNSKLDMIVKEGALYLYSKENE